MLERPKHAKKTEERIHKRIISRTFFDIERRLILLNKIWLNSKIFDDIIARAESQLELGSVDV